MSDEVKITLLVCLTIVLVIGLLAGSIVGFRWVKQQDTREPVDFSISIHTPLGYECRVIGEGDPYVLECAR